MSTRSAFVTGAGGFIGSHLTEQLVRDGWQVKALVQYNSHSSLGWLESLAQSRPPNLNVILGDIRDGQQMKNIIKKRDVVFHLAALIGIPYSYVAPASYIETNTVGTLNLAQAALAGGAARFVHTSTSETYGTAQYTPINEAHPLQAQSPYSASKIAADKLIESFGCSFGLPVITVRPFNTYGPRQSTRAVIPTIITQALKGPEVHLGSLTPVRDLTFVSDTVAGFIKAAEAPESALGQVYNLGTGNAMSIGDLAHLILELMGGGHRVICVPERVRPAQSEVFTLLSDNSLAKLVLGWSPQVSVRDGIEHTLGWLREHRDQRLAGEYTI